MNDGKTVLLLLVAFSPIPRLSPFACVCVWNAPPKSTGRGDLDMRAGFMKGCAIASERGGCSAHVITLNVGHSLELDFFSQ